MKKLFILALVVMLGSVGFIVGCEEEELEPENDEEVAPDEPVEAEYTMVLQAVTESGTLYDEWSQELGELIEEYTDGRVEVEQHPAGAIVGAADIPSAVQDGTLDASWDYSGLWAGYEHAAPLFTSVPGMFFDGRDYMMWMYEDEGLELWQDFMSDLGVHVLPTAFIDMEIFMWSNEPIDSMETFEDMEFRMMPIMGEVFEAYGFSSVFMPAGELVPALETGALDAAEFAIPTFDKLLGFHDVADYIHHPGFHQPSAFLSLSINEDWWNELPADLQQDIERAAQTQVLESWLDQGFRNVEALETFEEEGVERVELPEEMVEEMNEMYLEYMQGLEDEHPFTYEVFQSLEDFGERWFPYKRDIRMDYPARFFDDK